MSKAPEPVDRFRSFGYSGPGSAVALLNVDREGYNTLRRESDWAWVPPYDVWVRYRCVRARKTLMELVSSGLLSSFVAQHVL